MQPMIYADYNSMVRAAIRVQSNVSHEGQESRTKVREEKVIHRSEAALTRLEQSQPLVEAEAGEHV